MENGYKQAKEAFVSDMKGSTIFHINVISFVAWCSIALYSALVSRLPTSRPVSFPITWTILVVPLLLSMTIFANNSGLLSILLLLPTGVLLLLPRRESGTPLPSPMSPGSPRQQNSLSPKISQTQITPLPALTVYRAHMMLMTILAILAVDFPVFPRSLAKCESFGVSLMDMGVGSFVFSQGVVSAIPLLKNPAYLTAPLKPKVFSVIRKTLPIIFLGLVRVLLVKGTEYPEHESEYGTHWNFFITLALLPILQVLLHPIILHLPLSLVGVIVVISQQVILSIFGMQQFVLHAPRTNLFSANKEGIVSLAGCSCYLSIHLFGLSTGTLILPPSPKFFRRMKKLQARLGNQRRNSNVGSGAIRNSLGDLRQNDKTITELCAYTVVWWGLLGALRLLGIADEGVSRRMANISYVIWVVAFNTSFLLGYFLLDLYFFPSPMPKKSVYSSPSKRKGQEDNSDHGTEVPFQQQKQPGSPPALLEAINKNGLVLFLIANVATGVVNFTIPTMYTSDFWAMLVLCGYAFGISMIAWTLRNRRLLQL